MSAPSTAVVGLGAEITWTEPAAAGGLPIIGYKVFLRTGSGAFLLETTYCAVATTSCTVPLLALQQSPWGLALGALVQVKVRATNLLGDSVDSSPNTAGALIETVPSSPPVAPLRNALTGTSSITVDYHPLAGAARGGAPILSYELQWDQGSAGATWVSLVGAASDSVLTQFTVQDAQDPAYVVSGTVYEFRYRARNRQGWGAFSSATSIMAAAEPGQLSPVATAMNGANVRLAWTTADQPSYSDGGQPITAFEVRILGAGGVPRSGAPIYCASSPQMLASRLCEIPMAALTAQAGLYRLPLGRLIQATVAARNSVGLGPFSALNSVGVLAQTAPLAPASPPTRDPASTQRALVVHYPFPVTTQPLPGFEDGGSTLLSLNLQWDQGSAGAAWVTLVGESPRATTDSYTVLLAQDGSDAGRTYKFRARAYNIHGWGPFSAPADVLAADFPGVVDGARIAKVGGTDVELSWRSPEPNGSPVDAFAVEIRAADGTYHEETTWCSGAVDPASVGEASCRVPMAAFSSAPWLLPLGSAISFRVSARNAIGWQSTPSSSPTGLVLVETAPPGSPAPLGLDLSQTSESQVRLVIPEIPDSATAANGGSPILSYGLEWDAGSAGAGFTALAGEASDSLQRAFVIPGLSAGAAYEFRYRVRSVHGWGGYSAVLVAIAARPPDAPAQPVTSNTGTSVRVAWTEPYSGGSPITALLIEIRAADGVSFAAQPLYCNGLTDTTVLAQGYCAIPTSALRAAPHNLPQGALVVARLRASNAVGSSPYSDDGVLPGVSYADVRTVPHTPPSPPARGPATSTGQIEVVVPALTGALTGGSPILSYEIEYDAASAGASWTELQGYSSNSLSLSVVKPGLPAATVFQVRYRARNAFGWSASYSEVAAIATVASPGAVPAPSITATKVGTNVRVAWAAAADNGSPVSRYEVLFATRPSASPVFAEETAFCDGGEAAVLLAQECTIPMSRFWLSTTASPFQYVAGEAISLRVRAWNALGAGPFSGDATGPTVETPPDTPPLPPAREEAGTSTSQISVTMPEIVSGSLAAGGASVSSYNLEWNQGSGTTFYEVVGQTADNLDRVVTVASLVAGHTYTFRYRIQNIHGWSPGYSPTAQIMAAKTPSAPAAPSTALAGATVTITWAAPADNGAPILSYVVEIQGSAGDWLLETTDCDGADPATRDAASCSLPQATLTDPAGPFRLSRGELVVARVAAANTLGQGDPSPPNSVGARIQTLPAAPHGLTAGAATSASEIELLWAPLVTDEERGGVLGEVAITSYQVDWDAGSATGPWAELVGLSSAYTGTDFTTSPADPAQVLVPGRTYRFRVRAQNAQGWGGYSATLSILAAGVPEQMAMLSVADVAGLPSVRVEWTAPDAHGSPLTAYEVRLLSASAGAYYEASECDTAAALASGGLHCEVLMSTLREPPFSLSLGDPIVAIARAANALGWSPLYSEPNSGLAVTVQEAPDAPASAPVEVSAGPQSLTVEMPLVPTEHAGGSPLTSYNLQYDQGGPLGTGQPGAAADGDFVSLIGEVPDTNTA
jgi:hypothetical protein